MKKALLLNKSSGNFAGIVITKGLSHLDINSVANTEKC